MDQPNIPAETRPLLSTNEASNRLSSSDANLPTGNQENLCSSMNFESPRDPSSEKTLQVGESRARKYSDSCLVRDEMQQPQHQARYKKNSHKKLSQSRGIKLPAIKFDEVSRPQSIALGELKREYPPSVASPIGYTLRHDALLAQDLNRSAHSESFNVDPNSGDDNVLDIRIFFSTGKAVQLSVEDGAEATAADLLPLVSEHLEIDEDIANEALALWLVSPLLEIQLKPHHVAYQVHSKWPTFLRRFTTAEEEQIAFDLPILLLRRNVYMSIPVEVMYQDQDEHGHLTEILYFDAKDEYMAGRYLVDVETCVKVAALQLSIEFGPHENDEESADTVHENLAELVPAYLLNRVKAFYLFGQIECKSGWEKHIVREYKLVSQLYSDNHARRKAYLEVLRETPFYGATFFSATTDRRQSSSVFELSKRLLIGSQSQLEITVGVSNEYVTLVDRQKNELLLTRSISDISWFRSSESHDDDEGIPSFFLHFPDDEALNQQQASSGDDCSPAPQTPPAENGAEIPSGRREQQEKRTSSSSSSASSSPCSSSSASPVFVSRLLQLFTKQAALLESILNALYERNAADFGSVEALESPVSLLAALTTQPSPQSEIASPLSNVTTSSSSARSGKTVASRTKSNSRSEAPSPSSSSSHQYASKLSKLCLATLDPNGRCLDAKGNLRRILLECN